MESFAAVAQYIVGLSLAFACVLPAGASEELFFQSSEKQATLIELYSSEGCSSCPPAEKWIGQLKTSPDLWKQIVPIVFHVDYWDGLGWPDRFARAQFTQRQRNYSGRLGQNSIYTPEFIVNAREWRDWYRTQPVPELKKEVGVLRIELKGNGRHVEARFSPLMPQGDKNLRLEIALLGMDLVSDVKRGENSGLVLHHQFVVLNLISVPITSAEDGTFQTSLELPASGTKDKASALAAWITDDKGAYIQAVGGWL